MRQVIYMAHPVAPTEDEVARIPMEIVQAGVGEYEFDLRLPRSLADRAAVRARVEAWAAVWTDAWQEQEARYQDLLVNEEKCGERLERALAAVEA